MKDSKQVLLNRPGPGPKYEVPRVQRVLRMPFVASGPMRPGVVVRPVVAATDEASTSACWI